MVDWAERPMCVIPYHHGFDRHYVDGLVQERHNSIANALELRLSCTNPLMLPIQCHSLGKFSSSINKILQNNVWFKFTNILVTDYLWCYAIYRQTDIHHSAIALYKVNTIYLQFPHYSRHPFLMGCWQQMGWDYEVYLSNLLDFEDIVMVVELMNSLIALYKP